MVINFTNVTSIFGLYFCNGLFHYYHSNHYIVIYVDVDIFLPLSNSSNLIMMCTHMLFFVCVDVHFELVRLVSLLARAFQNCHSK